MVSWAYCYPLITVVLAALCYTVESSTDSGFEMAESLDMKTSSETCILICVDMHLQVHLNHFWCKISPLLIVLVRILSRKLPLQFAKLQRLMTNHAKFNTQLNHVSVASVHA